MSEQPKLNDFERAEFKRLSERFPGIVDEGRAMGSFDYYILDRLWDAEKENEQQPNYPDEP